MCYMLSSVTSLTCAVEFGDGDGAAAVGRRVRCSARVSRALAAGGATAAERRRGAHSDSAAARRVRVLRVRREQLGALDPRAQAAA